jgi:hypothetical protein
MTLVEAVVLDSITSSNDFRTFLDGITDLLIHLLQSFFIDQRADFGIFVDSRTSLKF